MQNGNLLKENGHKRIKANYHHFEASQIIFNQPETAKEHSYITETPGKANKTF